MASDNSNPTQPALPEGMSQAENDYRTADIIEQLQDSHTFDYASATDDDIVAEMARRLLASGRYTRPYMARAIASAALAQFRRQEVEFHEFDDAVRAGLMRQADGVYRRPDVGTLVSFRHSHRYGIPDTGFPLLGVVEECHMPLHAPNAWRVTVLCWDNGVRYGMPTADVKVVLTAEEMAVHAAYLARNTFC